VFGGGGGGGTLIEILCLNTEIIERTASQYELLVFG